MAGHARRDRHRQRRRYRCHRGPHRDLVADRLNARTVKIVGGGDAWGELAYSAEADMSELEPAFGADAGRVMNALNEARVDEGNLETLEAAVSDTLGESTELTDKMVSFRRETPKGITSTEFEALGGHGVVYVDTTLTEDIESEGYARKVIRRVQEMRKDLELDLEERIRLDLAVADDRIGDLVREHETLITEEVRADAFATVDDGHCKTWDVEGVEMEISTEAVAAADVSDEHSMRSSGAFCPRRLRRRTAERVNGERSSGVAVGRDMVEGSSAVVGSYRDVV